ncbi:matrixin family metalloprotease [Actinoplanes sp. G11-F43]|uniref:matrixin family metalloprotease n=1 Tax=Actinoplanes sp. G11-F43 TaxID=3424130 RepID=UPI003D335144
MIPTSELVERIRAEAPRVPLICERLGIDTERLVVEGDVGLTEQNVLSYAARRIEIAEALQADPDAEKQGLLGIERDGRTLRWRPGKTLTYVVWRPSFPNDQEYRAVVDGMASAVSDWQSICGIRFEHVAAKDTDEGLKLGDVTFPVLRQAGGGTTVAMAFFPDEPLDRRVVWAFDGFFDTDGPFSPVGVMRHELGHTLGFRHEHIRPETPEDFAPENMDHVIELTGYDPRSVMHYLGRNVGDPQLRFTESDRIGARLVYGGPDAEFSYAD